MTEKETAKAIFDNIVNEGKSTDYFWSDNFYRWAKQMAIERAKDEYTGIKLSSIVAEIQNYPE